MSKTLKDWSAARSGSSITIHGINVATRESVRLTQVETIVPGTNHCVARDAAGNSHTLLIG